MGRGCGVVCEELVLSSCGDDVWRASCGGGYVGCGLLAVVVWGPLCVCGQ